MRIERVNTATDEIVEAFGRLFPQLTANHPPPNAADLEALLRGENSVLLIARAADAAGQILGTGCLGFYRAPTGVRAVIEDVVVDRSARGQGIGEALMAEMLGLASKRGAPGVSLTSNPAREAANRLYVRLGFSVRATNCYYYAFRD